MIDIIKGNDGKDIKFDGVRHPYMGEVVRVHPSKKRRKECLFAFDDHGKMYLVAKHMEKDVEDQMPPEILLRAVLFQAQNREGVTFLWPVPVPVPDNCPVYDAMKDWVVWVETPEQGVH